MLVLSRRSDSGIKIGADITVKVLSIRRQNVQLGIEAPKHVRVLRDELCDQEFERPQRANAGTFPRTPGMKIVLVIEDDPWHAKLICKSLCRRQGTMVTVVETASRALDALGTLSGGSDDEIVHPDLVLLDVGLPDSSGLEVLRTIRSDDRLRRTPVVMLTCCQDDAIVEKCIESGANAFVVKSTSWDEFHASVSRIGEFWTNENFPPLDSRPMFHSLS